MATFERVSPELPDVAVIIDTHFALMREQTPAESCHVLSPKALAGPDIQLFAVREHGSAIAIGALMVGGSAAELKSMHTVQEVRGRGFGRRLLDGLITEARALGLLRLNLETGSGQEHGAARRLYAAAGFEVCPPFPPYEEDPSSLFMTKAL